MEDRIEELEAMLIDLSKRIEKLEGRTRIAPPSAYLRDLKQAANKILSNWS